MKKTAIVLSTFTLLGSWAGAESLWFCRGGNDSGRGIQVVWSPHAGVATVRTARLYKTYALTPLRIASAYKGEGRPKLQVLQFFPNHKGEGLLDGFGNFNLRCRN